MARRTALVLGGGGLTGIAWELGLLTGLAASGLDLTDADVVVGTSAGSVVGAQIRSGTPLEELFTEQLRDPTGELVASIGLPVNLRYVGHALRPGTPRQVRQRIGRAALQARTVTEAERREVIAQQLRSPEWPERELLVTAVEASSGQMTVFSKRSGVRLVDAVGASCAVPLVWPPVTVDGRRYVDGGVRSPVNADLARGCDRVVVLAPVTAAARRVSRIPEQLRGLGPHVRSVLVTPNPQAREAIGRNVLDPVQRAATARAGRAQAAGELERLGSLWR